MPAAVSGAKASPKKVLACDFCVFEIQKSDVAGGGLPGILDLTKILSLTGILSPTEILGLTEIRSLIL